MSASHALTNVDLANLADDELEYLIAENNAEVSAAMSTGLHFLSTEVQAINDVGVPLRLEQGRRFMMQQHVNPIWTD